MTSAESGDHGSSIPTRPDPQGAAALSLVESLIHFLMERSVLAHADALEVVQIATDAQVEISVERGDDLGAYPEAEDCCRPSARALRSTRHSPPQPVIHPIPGPIDVWLSHPASFEERIRLFG